MRHDPIFRLPLKAAARGIAIGPILFVLALLGILAAVMSAGNSGMGSAIRADSVTPQLYTQANLIRSKMFECNSIRGSWPSGDGNGTTMANVTCPNDPTGLDNLWTGARPTPLPPPPTNFGNWTYYDYSGSGGGRCVRIQPTETTVSAATKQGISKAYAKFTTQEAAYTSGSTAQQLIIWITRPSGSAGANCQSS